MTRLSLLSRRSTWRRLARRALVFGLLALTTAAPALAGPRPGESWMFRRSYYSHQPVSPVQIGRRSAGGPLYTSPQGSYVRSGYRNLRSTINVGGQQYDHVGVWESWIQYGDQY